MSKLIVFPYYRDNPYLNMLYLIPSTEGWQIEEPELLEEFLPLLPDLVAGDVINLHWTARIMQREPTREAALDSRAKFMNALTEAKLRGIKTSWTVHNLLPHEGNYLDLETELANFIADTVDIVHVMNPDTANLVAEHYTLPESKIVHIGHSSYWGVYDQSNNQSSARSHFGIPSEVPVVLYLGRIRPYKGLTALVGAYSALQSATPETVLMLGGKATPQDIEDLKALLPQSANIIARYEYIPADDLPLWFAAADVAVFPYEQILNSGSIEMAVSFGLPVVLPNLPALQAGYGGQPWVSFYDSRAADTNEAMAGSVLAALGNDGARDSATTYAKLNSPLRMTQNFSLRVLNELSK
jgi:glycosyltransferase involved in cell wall biosynthesis